MIFETCDSLTIVYGKLDLFYTISERKTRCLRRSYSKLNVDLFDRSGARRDRLDIRIVEEEARNMVSILNLRHDRLKIVQLPKVVIIMRVSPWFQLFKVTYLRKDINVRLISVDSGDSAACRVISSSSHPEFSTT